jgi:Flp pilus assembly protein TadD
VAAALATEPTHVLARLLAAALDHTEVTADEARAIVGAHEDDWRAWMLVAVISSQSGEAEAARVRACEIAAANPVLLPPPELCSGRRADLPSP